MIAGKSGDLAIARDGDAVHEGRNTIAIQSAVVLIVRQTHHRDEFVVRCESEKET